MKKTAARNTSPVSLLLWFTVLALISFVVWASYADIDQVTRARGQVIASTRTQIVQAPDGGVLDKLYVREGDTVRKGQLVARLDRSRTEAAFRDSEGRVAALNAAYARLRAEVYSTALEFPDTLEAYPAFRENQRALYLRRRAALEADIATLETQLGLAQKELQLNQPLLATGDVAESDIIRLRRQVADYQGKISSARNKFFQEAVTEMTKVEEDLSTQTQLLAERRALLDNTELHAPSDGFVKSINVTTLGGVAKPGEEVLQIVPTDSALIVEAEVKPMDAGFLRTGLPATVKLDAWDYTIYGTLKGRVSYISPDALTKKTPQGDEIFYRVQIRITDQPAAGRKKIEIQPGMTTTVEIRTGTQTVMHYLTKPVTKTLSESLGER